MAKKLHTVAVVLQPGTRLLVQFGDGKHGADGEFTIENYGDQIRVLESAGLPGSVVGEAGAVLYWEDGRTGTIDDALESAVATPKQKAKQMKKLKKAIEGSTNGR